MTCKIWRLSMPLIESARALLVDSQDRVLLMKLAFSEHRTYWLTPGGTLHPGESYEDALRREIREETGLTLAQPGHWVWTPPKRIVRDCVPVDMLARVYIQRVPQHHCSTDRAHVRRARYLSRVAVVVDSRDCGFARNVYSAHPCRVAVGAGR
jgi:8-oxo-dGTP pyrophosphatase MutT (NUDIX family)